MGIILVTIQKEVSYEEFQNLKGKLIEFLQNNGFSELEINQVSIRYEE